MALADWLAVPLSVYPSTDELDARECRELEGYLSDFYAAQAGRVFDWEAKPLRWRQAQTYLTRHFVGWQSQRFSQQGKALAEISAKLG